MVPTLICVWFLEAGGEFPSFLVKSEEHKRHGLMCNMQNLGK